MHELCGRIWCRYGGPVSLQCSAVYLEQELKKIDKIERFYFSLGMLNLHLYC